MVIYVRSFLPLLASGGGGGGGGGGSTVLVTEDALAEVGDHEGKTLTEGDLRLPSKELLGAGDVGLALVGVILGVFTELDLCVRVNGVLDNLGQLQHGELARVTQVEGANMLTFHQPHQTLHLVREDPYQNKVQCRLCWLVSINGAGRDRPTRSETYWKLLVCLPSP
jgi:hypothetical protein